ncbi:MAG: prolyl oligopeptidase family serine peptidase [Christensenellaceae bacterium]|jgi:dienelactone hydrolase|nr:prolyl oligopeptidase family serine peptidase [Christensenellaceae bacterium]
MQTTLVRFHTKENIRLDGLLFEPEKKTNKIVIHLHGTADYFYRQRFLDSIAKELTNMNGGYSLLTFDNRGSHEEYEFIIEKNNEKTGAVVIGAKNEIFEDCILDIDAAIKFAKSHDYKQIVLSGHSYGCNKVVYYAAQKNFDGKIILLAPCDMLELSKTDNPSGQYWQRREDENFDLFRYGIKTVSNKLVKLRNDILIEIGSDDDAIFQTNKQECIDYLKSAFKNTKLTGHIIKDAGHCYTGKYSEVARSIANWLRL